MKIKFKRKETGSDSLEIKLEIISDLTRGLGKAELKALLEAVETQWLVRQNLKKVKTDDEKEMAPIDEAERILTKEVDKKKKGKK